MSISLSPSENERLRLVANRLLKYPFSFWHYGDSIGFEGLLAASDLLGDPRYESWAHGAIRGWAARREPFRELDNTAPGHVMCLVAERTGDEAVLEAARALAGYLAGRRQVEGVSVSFERAPLREPYGGAALSEEEAGLLLEPGAGVFADCLHFDPPFFAHLGTLAGDTALVDLAAEQALAYVELLQDESGLFWHFWLEKPRRRYGYGWGRGQGWALLGLLDTLRYLPEEHSAAPRLRAAVECLAAALAATQQSDGSWAAVAGESDSGAETSTAAFAAAGLADGILGGAYRKPALAAWRSARSLVDETGLLTGVSAAVWASTEASHYAHVPRGFDVPWGQGTLLVAAKRIAGLAAA